MAFLTLIPVLKPIYYFLPKANPPRTFGTLNTPTYPEGYKSYSKTKPIRIAEFDLEKAWWKNRQESEQAWKHPFREIYDNAQHQAQPFWDAAEAAKNEVKRLEAKLKLLEQDLASGKTTLYQKDKNTLQKIEANISETRANIDQQRNLARESQSKGDGYYWAIYNLDQKNPNTPEDVHGEPEELLANYHALQAQIEQTRTQLKAELETALNHATLDPAEPELEVTQ